MIPALAILILCQLVGEIAARASGIAVPGPVLGFLLLFVALLWRGGVAEPMRVTARGLLSHLSLLFVPAGTGIMLQLGRLRAEWLPILASLLISTALAIGVTAAVFLAVERALGRRASRERP
jgi:holin-like protein